MRVVGQVPLLDQGRDLLRRQTVAGADSGVTGHQAEQVVEQLFARRRPVLADEVIDHRLEDGPRRSMAEQGRIAREQDRAAAEVLDAEAELGQGVAVFEGAGRLVCGQLDRLRDQQVLRFQGAGADAAFQLLEEDAFVQGVLIDDQHSLRRLQDEIGVIQLEAWRIFGEDRRPFLFSRARARAHARARWRTCPEDRFARFRGG